VFHIGVHGLNYCPSDPLIDQILVEICNLAKEEEKTFYTDEAISSIKSQIECLENRGIDKYISTSYTLIKARDLRGKKGERPNEWMAHQAAERIRKIEKDSRHVVQQGKEARKYASSRDWLSWRIEVFIPDIKKLSETTRD